MRHEENLPLPLSSCNRISKMVLHMMCFILLSSRCVLGNEENNSNNYRSDGFMNRLTSGMKLAQNLLGSESVALKVAEFVVKAFQNANRPGSNRRHPYEELSPHNGEKHNGEYNEEHRPSDVDGIPNPMAPLRHLVRLFGLQPNQISAVAVNALVFVAQMISTFLAGPKRPGRSFDSEDPKSWLLNKNSRQLQDLIKAAKNESLPDSIEELIKEQGSEEETSCIRLLVCKITPYVNRMQKAVFGDNMGRDDSKSDLRGSAIMYRHLPSSQEINDRNDICERRHRNCDLNE